ncbi:MAG: L,D-transpeptidase [Actinomycetales bacterium]
MTGQHRAPTRRRPEHVARARLLVSSLAVAAVFALPLTVQGLTASDAASVAQSDAVDAADVGSAPPSAPAASTSASASGQPSARAAAARPSAAAPSAAGTSTAGPEASTSPTGAHASSFADDESLPAASGSGRRVVYSLSRQRDWIVDATGAVVATHLVSGQTGQPDPGTYRVYSKSRYARSAVSDETMEYMVRFAHGEETGAAIGFHSIPVHPDGKLAQEIGDLGEPLSAGCVRQKLADAKQMWDFAKVGTTVVVVP